MIINAPCIFSTRDEYGPIHVYQTRTSLILSFDGKVYQSYMKLRDVNGLALDYTRAMMMGLVFLPTLETASVMGLGAGSMVKSLLHRFPDLQVHAVEHREEVVKAAKNHFHLPETDRLTVHIEDAAIHIENPDSKSDIIFSDLYNAAGMEQLQVQTSYLRNCKVALTQHGVLVLNICHTALDTRKKLAELLSVEFSNRWLSFEVESDNTIILAFKNAIPSTTREELLARTKSLQERMNITLKPYAELLCESPHLR